VQLQIKSGFRRVWREAGSLQIGLSQRRGTVLAGLTPADVPLLEQLREGIDASAVEAFADGLDPERGRELVRLLTEADVLVRDGDGRSGREGLGPAAARLAPDAAIWSVVHPQVGDGWGLLAARGARRVIISGAGRLGSTLAATLAAAGVGHITVEDSRRVTSLDLAPAGAGQTDVGRLREDVAHDVVRRSGGRPGRGGTTPGHWSEGKPDLVVLIEHGAADAAGASRLVSADVAHLSVVIREDDVMVGPLVRPGSGPCLRCLDLHRGDRDPAWPSILAQLLGSPALSAAPEEVALSGLGAGLAALQVLGHLDDVAEPAAARATLEIELPDGLIARRTWPAHPGCGCHWPPANLTADHRAHPRLADARRTSGTARMDP
jgi:hypothetical protein